MPSAAAWRAFEPGGQSPLLRGPWDRKPGFPPPVIPANLGSHPARLALSDPSPDQRFESVLESVSDALYAVSPDWIYVIFNGAAERYFGISRQDVVGKGMWEVFPQGIGTPFEKVLRRAEEARELLMREVDHRSRNVLSVVQAIVRLTTAPDLDSYKAAVLSRINALARAQGALASRQ